MKAVLSAKFILACLMVGGLIVSACQPSAEAEASSPIAKIFRSKCQTCHSLKKPESRTDEEWAVTMIKHADRTKLTEEQQAKLLEYLQSSN